MPQEGNSQAPATPPPKPKSKLLYLISIVVLILLAGTAYFYFTSQKPDPTAYPQLEAGGSIFQGRLSKSEMYYQFTEEDVLTYEVPAWAKNISPESQAKQKRPLLGAPYVNYLYSTKDITIKEVIDNIVPVAGNEVFITVFNPKTGLLSLEEAGFHTFQESPYENAYFIDNPESFVIPANFGFQVFMNYPTEIWSLKNHTDRTDNDSLKNLLAELKNINGWVLLPMPRESNIQNLLKNNSDNRAILAKELKPDAQFTGADFNEANKGNINNFKVNEGFFMAWVKFGDQFGCDDGSYYANGACRKCVFETPPYYEMHIWHFDEGSGTTACEAIDNNFGLIHNALWSKGKLNSALNFIGKDSYLEAVNSLGYNNSPQVSVSLWANLTSPGQNGLLFGKGPHKILYDDITGWKTTYRIDGKNWSINWEQTAKPKTGTWYHIVSTYDGNTIKLYVNGEEMGSLTKPGLLEKNYETMMIGGEETGNYFNGMIDEVRIYQKALTKEEVISLYQAY